MILKDQVKIGFMLNWRLTEHKWCNEWSTTPTLIIVYHAQGLVKSHYAMQTLPTELFPIALELPRKTPMNNIIIITIIIVF